MPNKKPDPKTETSNTEPAKAVVSKLGVNDNPAPTEPKVVETKNGRTLTYN